MKSLKEKNRLRRKARIRVQGTPVKPRLVVFRSNAHISAQLIDDTQGLVLAAANDLKDKKGSKMERAQKVGSTLSKLAAEKNLSTCVFDRNAYKYHGRVKTLADAAREGGLKF